MKEPAISLIFIWSEIYFLAKFQHYDFIFFKKLNWSREGKGRWEWWSINKQCYFGCTVLCSLWLVIIVNFDMKKVCFCLFLLCSTCQDEPGRNPHGYGRMNCIHSWVFSISYSTTQIGLCIYQGTCLTSVFMVGQWVGWKHVWFTFTEFKDQHDFWNQSFHQPHSPDQD